MELLSVLVAVTVFPCCCLGFVLWMGRIEDSLPDAVRRAERAPDPPPVLAIPVQRPAVTEIDEDRATVAAVTATDRFAS